MANIIPPLVSDSPPPPPSDDEDDDEFDDFRESNDLSYGCDSFSLTPSPEQSPKKIPKELPTDKHKPDFNFDPVTSKSIIINPEDGIKIIENERDPHNDNESVVSSYSLKENQLSSSESSSISKSSGEESIDIVNKHNSVNKDLDMQIIEDIPSQLIFESRKLSEEDAFCDNSDKICETNQEILNEDKNKEPNMSNGFSVKDADSTRNFATITDYGTERSWSPNFVNSENYENNLESELSMSSDNVNNCDKSPKNITDREDNCTHYLSSATQSLTNETNTKLNVSNEDLKYEDSEDFSDALHSKISNNDLVNNENIKISTALDNEKNNFDHENNVVENIPSSQIESEDEEFGTFVSHPISSSIESSSTKEETGNHFSKGAHIVNNGNSIDISRQKESSSNEPVNYIENKVEIVSETDYVVHPTDIESNANPVTNDEIKICSKLENKTEIENENFTDFINHSTNTEHGMETSPKTLKDQIEIESDENFSDFVSHPIETETNGIISLPTDIQTSPNIEHDSDDSFKDSLGTNFNIIKPSNSVVSSPSKTLGDTENEYDDFVAHSINTSQTDTKIQNTKFDTKNSQEVSKNVAVENKADDDDDDFADFASFSPATIDNKVKEDKSKIDSSKLNNLSVSNKSVINPKTAPTTKFTKNNRIVSAPVKGSQLETDEEDSSDDDDFGDFTSFSKKRKPKKKQIKPKPKPNLDNEFWDFGDTACSTEDNQVFKPKRSSRLTKGPAVSEEEAFKRAQDAFKSMVLIPTNSLADDEDDFQYCELTSSKKESQDSTYYTTIPAYSFKWSNPDNEKNADADSASTLPSYSWKPSLPSFSLNLDDQPLEPVKMETSTSKSSTASPSINQANSQSQVEPQLQSESQLQTEPQLQPEPQTQPEAQLRPEPPQAELKPQAKIHTPSSQFDWIGSGLMSPVDYSPTDSTMPTSKPEVLKPDSPTDDHEDFASFHSSQSSDVSPVWPNIPLRETHISEFQQSRNVEVDISLQVTTVTKMSGKDVNSDDVSSFNTFKVEAKGTGNVQNDEDFDDFQMSVPTIKRTTETKESVNIEKNIVEHEVQPNKSILELPMTENVKNIESKELSDAFFSKSVLPQPSANFPKLNNSPMETVKPLKIQEKPLEHKKNDDEDDFTEFYSSAPLPEQQNAILTPSMEPLKPTPVYTNVPSTQINWPDPGVTDDEIRRFEAAFATPLNKKIVEKPKIEEKPKKSTDASRSAKGSSAQIKKPENRDTHASPRTDFPLWDTSPVHKPHRRTEKQDPKKGKVKQNSIEDDEWSDFVSAQKPSPINKIKHSNRNQTPSPDLTLSVLTLGSIQPTKQPIPVLTPQGILQTKLSANKNPFIQQQKSNMTSHKPYVSPFQTTNQYASQVYSVGMTASQPYDFMQASQMSNPNPNKKPGQSFGNRITSEQDDDEWGEFVSSPLPPQLQNSSTTTGSGWSKFVPNIRAAPASASNQSHFSGGNDKGLSTKGAKKKSSGVSGLVLPELKFLNLKDRSGVPKKK